MSSSLCGCASPLAAPISQMRWGSHGHPIESGGLTDRPRTLTPSSHHRHSKRTRTAHLPRAARLPGPDAKGDAFDDSAALCHRVHLRLHAAAWFTLGASVVARTGESDAQLGPGGGPALGRPAQPDRTRRRWSGRARSRSTSRRRTRRARPSSGGHRARFDRVPVPCTRARSVSTSSSTSGARVCSGTTPTASTSPASTGSATPTRARPLSRPLRVSRPPRASTTTSRSSSTGRPPRR